MSLPGKWAFNDRGNVRGRKWLLTFGVILLAVPCGGVAALTRGLDFDSFDPTGQSAQEPSKEYQQGKELGAAEARRKEQREREMTGAAEPSSQLKAELVERGRRERIEVEAKQTMQVALVNLARVPMDQAIQIATNRQPGKILACSLVGEHWESPGKLAADGRVLYHVVIISGDQANPVTTHILINAVDGGVIKVENEERGKERTRERVSSR